jgi:hypothetical protein
MLCRLVAHHSYAIVEADERGLAASCSSEKCRPPGTRQTRISGCGMTTSPDSELVPAGRRLAEIHYRCGPGHPVSRSIQRATPMILRAAARYTAGPSGPRSSPDPKAIPVSREASAEPLACQIPRGGALQAR